MKATDLSRLLRYGIGVFFLLPIVFFAWKFKFNFDVNASEVWWALKNSIFQSTLAGFFVVLLAVPMSFGLASISKKWQSTVSRMLLLPQILPVFFTALIAFSVIKPFPMGSAGIVILFVAINLGLATVLVSHFSISKLSSLAQTAEVFSISKFKFFLRVYFPTLMIDLLQIFFLVFVFCMSSFSVPILAGDGRAVNMEILVYEKVFIDNNWAAGFGVSLIQSFLVFGLSYLMLESSGSTSYLQQNDSFNPKRGGSFLRSKFPVLLIAVYLGAYVAGYMIGILKSLSYFSFLFMYSTDILSALLFSLKALLIFLVLNGGLLFLWLWDYLQNRRFNPVLHFVSLSTVVAGFSIYLFFPTSAEYDLPKLLLGASVLMFIPLFKLFLQRHVEALDRQLQVAEVFGLSRKVIISEVIVRQLHSQFFLWASVLSIWFVSDYAISRAVGLQTQTLGLMAQGFLTSYRMPAAFLMSVVMILFVGFFMFLFKLIAKAIYVAYKKFTI